jgi:ubiquinone/menaquinone biosynthesis C-methylase UbiE
LSWDKYLPLPSFLSISRKEVENLLLAYRPCSVLDIGAGYGRVSKFLQQNGFAVTCIDRNGKMIVSLRELGFNVQQMDARKLGFASNSFDLVVTDGLLEHFDDPIGIIREEARVTRRSALNFVPRKIVVNELFEKIQRVPKEHRRSEAEWQSIHNRCFPKVSVEELSRLLAIRCEKTA